MDILASANQLIAEFGQTMENPKPVSKGQKLYTGVDLGTAYIVLAVVDEEGNPIAGAMRFAQVVKDGLVVDYMGAINTVRELKNQLEEKLGTELVDAGVAYPPGTQGGDCKAIKHVAEATGFEVNSMQDEPTAANQVLGITDGAVVDIGGGTTGIAILKDGQVVYVADEATGGTHFSLVVAGALQLPFLEAEEVKRDPRKRKELFPVVKPTMQKIASIIKRHIAGHDVKVVYLVGGTACFEGLEKVVEDEIGIQVVKPDNPLLVTPLGIALGALRQ